MPQNIEDLHRFKFSLPHNAMSKHFDENFESFVILLSQFDSLVYLSLINCLRCSNDGNFQFNLVWGNLNGIFSRIAVNVVNVVPCGVDYKRCHFSLKSLFRLKCNENSVVANKRFPRISDN